MIARIPASLPRTVATAASYLSREECWVVDQSAQRTECRRIGTVATVRDSRPSAEKAASHRSRCSRTSPGPNRFIERIRSRLDAGTRGYGDTSFTRPAAEQELEDVTGCPLLEWTRLERLRGDVERLEAGGNHE